MNTRRTKFERHKKTDQECFDYFTEILSVYLGLIKRGAKLDFPNAKRCGKWASYAAHAAFKLHPELRLEGSQKFYRIGKNMGYRGRRLSQFIHKNLEVV